LICDYGFRIDGNGNCEWISLAASGGYGDDGVDDIYWRAGGIGKRIICERRGSKPICYSSTSSRNGKAI
jgi:hypothetical protein